jgi:hypothetical protein
MLRRHRVKHTASLEERIAERVDEIREALPLGSRERERLERQANTASHISDWLRSPGLQPPGKDPCRTMKACAEKLRAGLASSLGRPTHDGSGRHAPGPY